MRVKQWIALVLTALLPLLAGAVPITSFPATVNGELSIYDTMIHNNSYYADTYEVTVQAGQELTIHMTTTSFDSYLELLNAQGTVIATNDDYNDSVRASRIVYLATTSETLTIRPTSYDYYETGSYTLSVQSAGGSLVLTPPQTVNGALVSTDGVSLSMSGSRADSYQINLQAGQTIVVDLASTVFDAYLAIWNATKTQKLAFNDDAPGSLDSRISFTAPSTGTYFIEATAYSGTGSYTLSVQLQNAAPVTDTQSPTVPVNLTISQNGSSEINLGWAASTDNVGVTAYNVYQDGTLIAALGNVTSHTVTGLSPGSSYTFRVSACDAVNNCSSQSTSSSLTLLPTIVNLTASFTASTLNGTAPLSINFTGQGSSSVSADTLSYYWNFGDGQTSTERNPSHSYTTAGTYTVTLTVSNATGQSQTSSGQTITVTQAFSNLTASFTASTLNGPAPLSINFTEQATSSVSMDTLSYSWNFGDGQISTERNPSHSYTTAGTYTVTLTVSNTTGQSQTSSGQTITVTQAFSNLTASFTASTLNGTAPLSINFTGQGSSSVSTDTLSYFWDFGDGKTSTERNPSHSYTTAGTYTVTLTVRNANGQSQTSSGQTITVTQAITNLTASFTASVLTGTAPLAVTFTGQGTSSLSTDTLRYRWDFGDGQTSTESNPNHSYATAGAYTVILTVTNTAGQSVTSSSQSITVSRGSVPVTGKARLRPQVIMGGFDPILLDIADQSFKLIAIVRPGAARIDSVQVSSNAGGFSTVMNYAGTLDNGDQLYEKVYTYPRFAFPENMVMGDLFGTAAAEFQMTVVDVAQQRHSFPHLEFGNNTQLSTPPTSPATAVSSTPGIKRPRPQVLAAGFDPQLIDLDDTSFDVVAIVRPGLVPIQSVSLSTNSGGFSLAMNSTTTLPNDDRKYKLTYTYPRGSFPAMQLGDLFGTERNEFNIVVTDEAQQTHHFPELRAGNYPAQ